MAEGVCLQVKYLNKTSHCLPAAIMFLPSDRRFHGATVNLVCCGMQLKKGRINPLISSVLLACFALGNGPVLSLGPVAHLHS